MKTPTTDLYADIPEEYKALIIELAKLENQDQKWIERRYAVHRLFMIHDAHHGYDIENAIEDVQEEIKSWKRINKV